MGSSLLYCRRRDGNRLRRHHAERLGVVLDRYAHISDARAFRYDNKVHSRRHNQDRAGRRRSAVGMEADQKVTCQKPDRQGGLVPNPLTMKKTDYVDFQKRTEPLAYFHFPMLWK